MLSFHIEIYITSYLFKKVNVGQMIKKNTLKTLAANDMTEK